MENQQASGFIQSERKFDSRNYPTQSNIILLEPTEQLSNNLENESIQKMVKKREPVRINEKGQTGEHCGSKATHSEQDLRQNSKICDGNMEEGDRGKTGFQKSGGNWSQSKGEVNTSAVKLLLERQKEYRRGLENLEKKTNRVHMTLDQVGKVTVQIRSNLEMILEGIQN